MNIIINISHLNKYKIESTSESTILKINNLNYENGIPKQVTVIADASGEKRSERGNADSSSNDSVEQEE